MDVATIIFLLFSFGSLGGAFVLEGGKLGALFALTAAMIVFGGTIGAVGVSFPIYKIKRLPKIFGVAFKTQKSDAVESLKYFVNISKKTRQNGLLSIESEISDNSIEPFVKKGLQLIVDGTEPAVVRSILETEAEMIYERHTDGIAMFEAAGGYSPTMGVIGTVMGLVHVLSNLDDPASLGPKIAVAFIATLYGVGTANLLWLPIAAKLKNINKDELKDRTLIIEAIMNIQEGVNPNTLAEKLKSFLDKNQLKELEQAGVITEV